VHPDSFFIDASNMYRPIIEDQSKILNSPFGFEIFLNYV
jgi:hypothetical protein